MIGVEFTLTDGTKDCYDPVDEFEFATGETLHNYEFYVGGNVYTVPKHTVEEVRKYELCGVCRREVGDCEHDEREPVEIQEHECPDCFPGMYPYYGLAPHTHDMNKTGLIIGSTVIDKAPYPDNFSEDHEAEGCGVYTHCLTCQSSKSDG